MLRIIFCGDRNWKDQAAIVKVMSAIKDNIGDFVVIEGEAKGADALSRYAAMDICKLPVQPVFADWKKLRKAAGPIRNTEMRVKHKADAVVAFHENLQLSKGTKNMVEQSLKAGLQVWTYEQGTTGLLTFIQQLKRIQNERRDSI